MAETTITNLPNAAALTGAERVPMDQGGTTVDATTAAIAGTLPDATTSTAGKMTATDKTRLDQLGADDSPSFAGLTITGTDPVEIPHIHGDLAGTLYFHVKNTSGGTLTKGTPVSVVGAVGDTTTLEVVATNPGVAGRTHAHGLLYSELANNGFGHAVVLGELQGMNTAALASSSELWVGAAGGTTGTRPATAAQQVATVGRQHATTGTLLVSIEGVEPTPGQIGAQPLDADLTEIAALTTAAFGRGLLTAADAAAARTAIGAGTSDVAVGSSNPAALGAAAAPGSSGDAARSDHVHARSTYADLGPVADGIIFTISNRGETATVSTNYDESLPLSFAATITKITFITHIDNTGSSTTTLSAYKRAAAGTKTALLSTNATLVSGASVATGSLSGTAGVLSLASGDRLGVDLIGLGTGASGIKCIIEYTRSPV